MAQLKQDEWPSDREPTTQESQVVNRETETPPPDAEEPQGTRDDVIANVEPEQATG